MLLRGAGVRRPKFLLIPRRLAPARTDTYQLSFRQIFDNFVGRETQNRSDSALLAIIVRKTFVIVKSPT
jgi:hypothetical protein